jgi:CYTH domain-containing protein
LWVLEVELTEDAAVVLIPEELSIDREVTNDSNFKNYELSKLAPVHA